MNFQKIILNEERNVTLNCYTHDISYEREYPISRPGIIVIPGGGYEFCSDREADPIANAFLKAGFNAYVLRYSIKKDKIWPQPLNDYDQAFEYIKAHKEEFHQLEDKIAVIGFSAGGHLAASAAVLGKNKPVCALLGYAVLNEDVHGCNKSAPNVVELVNKDTPPMFLFATRTDCVVPIKNTLDMVNALEKYNISFELHIYPYGDHGFSTAEKEVLPYAKTISPNVKNWFNDAVLWLKALIGDFENDTLSKPIIKNRINGDFDDYLSVDCTPSLIIKDDAAREYLRDILLAINEKEHTTFLMDSVEFKLENKFIYTLRNYMTFLNYPLSKIEEVNEYLKKIKNPRF